METLIISKNNFWIKLYCFIFNIDKDDSWELPQNTCELRKYLILGIPILVIALPLITIFFILRKIFKDVVFEKDIIPGISFIYTFIGLMSIGLFIDSYVTAGGIPMFFVQYYKYNLIILGMGILLMALVFPIVLGIAYLLNYVKFRKQFFKVIEELYKSSKEKYCKKIDYVD